VRGNLKVKGHESVSKRESRGEIAEGIFILHLSDLKISEEKQQN
jgi:hypothetical protein